MKPRIIAPAGGMSQPHYTDQEIMLMQAQGLAGLWALYAEHLRMSDTENKEEIAAAASSRAAGYIKTVIDGAEQQFQRQFPGEEEEDASKRR